MHRTLALLTALALGTIACGGGSSDSSGAAGASTNPAPAGSSQVKDNEQVADACSLLSDEEVAALMAEPALTKNATTSTPGLSVCQWDGTQGLRFVYLTVRRAEAGDLTFTNSFKAREGAHEVTGIANEAVAVPGQSTPNDYHFLTGAFLTDTLFVQIDVAGPNRASDEDALSVLVSVMGMLAAKLN